LFIIPATLVTSDLGKEKELRTLSTILIAPVSRASILMGKLMAEAVVWGIYIIYLLVLTRALMPEALEELSFEALSNFFIMFWALGIALGSIGLLSAVTSETAGRAESSSKLAVFIAGLMTALGYVLLKAEVEPLASILLYPSPFSYAIDGAMYPLLGIGPTFDVLALFGFTLLFLFISARSFEKQDVF
jgi:ABC-type Na+ efflux pump permease subunit